MQHNLDLLDCPETIEITENGTYLGIFRAKSSQDDFKRSLNFIHKDPNISSDIRIKAVLEGDSKFDLEAKLIIENGAKNTDTYLKIDCLVIGEQARARVVPGLEIEEDEVKAGHGASVGHLEQDQLYYLMSRGLDKHITENFLVAAFLSQ